MEFSKVCNSNGKQERKPQWRNDKQSEFLLNIDQDKPSALKNVANNIRENLNSINLEQINSVYMEIGQVFTNASVKIFPLAYSPVSGNKTKSKRWFGYQCENARRKYHKARKTNKKQPSDTNRTNLETASKTYKNTTNFYINKHNKSTQDKLRHLKSKNPKDFWKIMNSLDKAKDNESINIETLYNYFKTLNEQNENEEITQDLDIDINNDDELLNSQFTEEEIHKCIKIVKNNKSSSNDKIINEYLKSTVNMMLPVYISFFNIVLETGIILDSWIEGIIRPIYKNNGDPKNPESYRPITMLSCFGKRFTAVLNLRLNKFLKQNYILEENQAGFRDGSSTTDHIFTLHALAELKSKNKKTLLLIHWH